MVRAVSRLCPLLIATVVLPILFLPGRAWAAAPREALVIGNSNYEEGDEVLKTPLADADAMARTLGQDGFDVTIVKNATRRQMQTAIDQFLGRVADGSDVAIFYAGYGIQVGRKNYLVPTDAHIWSETDVLRDGLSVDGLIGDAARKGAGTRIVMLDASRRNPFERRFRGLSAGLAAVTPRSGVLSISSAAAGTVSDDAGAENSAFTAELRKQIPIAGRSAEDTFKASRDAISRASQGARVPAVVSSLETPFFFDPSHKPESNVAAASSPTPVPDEPRPVAKPQPSAAAPRPEPPQAAADDLPPLPQPEAPKGKPDNVASYPPTQVAVAPPTTVKPTPLIPPPQSRPYAAEESTRKAELDALIARNPRDKSAIAERGELLAQHAEYASALADFERVLRLDPRNVEALNNRCFMRTVTNALEAALNDCNEVLRLRHDFADAYDSRGLIFLKLDQPRAALADYDAAIKIDPSHSSALYGRGIAKLRLGEKAGAERDFASALGLNGTIDKDYAQYGVH